MYVSYRLVLFAGLLTLTAYASATAWASISAALGQTVTAYLVFLPTIFGLMAVLLFTLSLLGIFADGKLDLSGDVAASND